MAILIMLFSGTSYLLFLLAFLYLLGFLANIQITTVAEYWPLLKTLVPYAIDQGRAAPSMLTALLINSGLIALFGLQHSVMARPGFKAWWTSLVPPSAERSVYVLASSLVLVLLMWLWQPMPDFALWQTDVLLLRVLAWSLLGLGVVILLWATFLIDHFSLFGLKQAWTARTAATQDKPRFVTPMLYALIRHPIYLGWLLIFWATPDMTLGHLVFATGMSAYIFIGIRYEERDLIAEHGEVYRRYREQVPMVVPRLGQKA